jgi:hypothetical protein
VAAIMLMSLYCNLTSGTKQSHLLMLWSKPSRTFVVIKNVNGKELPRVDVSKKIISLEVLHSYSNRRKPCKHVSKNVCDFI